MQHPDGGVGYGQAEPIGAGKEAPEDDELAGQYHYYLKRKEETRRRIEDLMRERDFLSGLEPGDVAYMNQKETEHELQNQREQVAAQLYKEAEQRAASPGR